MSRTTQWGLLAILGLVLVFALIPRPGAEPYTVGPARPSGRVTPQFSMSWDAAMLLAPDGSLWAWGGVQFGLMGTLSNRTVTPVPVRVGNDSDWLRASMSGNHTFAIKRDGTLWGWGWNFDGILTQTPTNRVPEPWRIGNANDWTDVRCGASHAIGLKQDGTLWVWGQNRYGQIGDGTTNSRSTPFQVTTNRVWKAIAASSFNSYAIAQNGTLWGWGLCGTGPGNGPDNLVPIQLDRASNWVAISSGDYAFAALRDDGTLWAAGQNVGSFGTAYARSPTNRVSGPVQIGSDTNWSETRVGQNGLIARKRDGTWWASSSDPSIRLLERTGEPLPRNGMYRIGETFDPWAVALGNGTAAVLARDGTLWTAGEKLGEPDRVRFGDFARTVLLRLTGSSRSGRSVLISDRWLRYRWVLPPPPPAPAVPDNRSR